MFAGGAGLDYRVLPYLNVRAEFEYQKWMSFPPNGLTPSVITIGAAYHFGAGKLSR
jgi:opacity protein-like surface antigen